MNAAALPRPDRSAHARRAPSDVVGVVALVQAIVGILLISGLAQSLTLLQGSASGFEDRDAGSTLTQVIGVVAYLPALFFMLSRPTPQLKLVARAWPVILMQVLILLSAIWAVQPGTSIRRSIALSIEMLFVWHIATYFTARQFTAIVAWVFAVLLILSFLAIGVPHLGITPNGAHAGKLRGIFSNKNILGELAGTAGVCFMAAGVLTRNRRLRLFWFGMIGLVVVELLLADSRTPLMSMMGAFAAMWSAGFVSFPRGWQLRFQRSLRILMVTAGWLIVAVLLPMLFAVIITALGRTMTLSGRVKLWQYAIGKGWARPWFGAGYQSFWNDELTFDLRALHESWGYGDSGAKALTGNAHNGYIDMWLQLGLLGLAALLTLLAVYIVRLARTIRVTRDPLYIWHVGTLVFVLIYYLTESEIMVYNELSWFLVIYGLLSVSARTIVNPGGSQVTDADPSRRYRTMR